MYLRAIILAFITIGITVFIEVRNFKQKGIDFFELLIGILVALIFLSYPLYEEYTGVTRIACTVLFAIQVLTLNEDFEIINLVDAQGWIKSSYVILNYILYFIAPLLSATTIISIFGHTFSKFRFLCTRKSEYHIFSEKNEKTIALASKISDTNLNAKIIFANKDAEKITLNKRFLCMKEKINELELAKVKAEKYLYFMSADEDENLNESLQFLENAKPQDKAKIYILNDTVECYTIIDSFMNQNQNKNENIQVEIIDETERIVLQRLQELNPKKIFKQDKKVVTVLIVGCGKFGEAFLKAITWCFQVIGYKLKIIIIDKNGKAISQKIACNEPELLKRYNIKIIYKNIEEVISKNILKKEDIDYAVISAGTDTNNFNIAVALRRYFLAQNKDVLIDIAIRNEYKSKNISILKDDANKDFNFNTFGSIEEAYYKNSIINSDIEKMAKKLHLIYSSGKETKNTYNSEYNRKASRATVVHAKYKLYSVLKENYTGEISKDIKAYNKALKDNKTQKRLADNEHDRWMAYMFTDGYKTASIEDVENYYTKIGNKHKNTLAKLHPALVPNKELPEVEKNLSELTKKLTGKSEKYSFAKSDEIIVKKLSELFKDRQ